MGIGNLRTVGASASLVPRIKAQGPHARRVTRQRRGRSSVHRFPAAVAFWRRAAKPPHSDPSKDDSTPACSEDASSEMPLSMKASLRYDYDPSYEPGACRMAVPRIGPRPDLFDAHRTDQPDLRDDDDSWTGARRFGPCCDRRSTGWRLRFRCPLDDGFESPSPHLISPPPRRDRRLRARDRIRGLSAHSPFGAAPLHRQSPGACEGRWPQQSSVLLSTC